MPQNVMPHLAQPENNTSLLIESNSQIKHSLEALPLLIGGIGTIPVVSSTLISPLLAYIFLTLLIIAVIWFVVLRHIWNIGSLKEPLLYNKKSNQLWDI